MLESANRGATDDRRRYRLPPPPEEYYVSAGAVPRGGFPFLSAVTETSHAVRCSLPGARRAGLHC
jgi:hypothetical protein